MSALLFSSRPAAWIAYAILLLSLAVEIGTGSRAGAGDRPDDRGTKYLLVITAAVAVVLSLVAARQLPSTQLPAPWVMFAVGCGVAIAGIVVRRWAIAMLGRFFTREVMIREHHHVVTSGPYRVLRHPAYSGTFLTALGFGMMMGSWLSIVIIGVGTFTALLPRIRHEEAVLVATLGEPYRDFARGRKRLIPFVW